MGVGEWGGCGRVGRVWASGAGVGSARPTAGVAHVAGVGSAAIYEQRSVTYG